MFHLFYRIIDLQIISYSVQRANFFTIVVVKVRSKNLLNFFVRINFHY